MLLNALIKKEIIEVTLVEALDQLDPRHKLVLEMVFGLNGTKQRTMVEIAKVLGISNSRVSQIRDAALYKMRFSHPSLRDYFCRS